MINNKKIKLKEIISKLEKRFPIENAEEWDNIGLLVGKKEKEITKIQLSLDVTLKAIDEAIKNNVDLIISHHPLIFSPVKKINDSSLVGKKLLKLIENNISVYSMHTNLDSTRFGLNDFVGEKLGFLNGKILDKNKNNNNSPNNIESGIGRVYSLQKEISIQELIKFVKERLNLEKVIVSGQDLENKIVNKIAIVNGSGSSYWKKAKRMGADVLLTGDLKYHEALDAREEDMTILDIGHYESEHFFNEIIKEILEEFDILKNFEKLEISIFNDDSVLIKK